MRARHLKNLKQDASDDFNHRLELLYWLLQDDMFACAGTCKLFVESDGANGHLAGGELEQIQFLLWHVSVQTTERYFGCKQELRCAVNDRLGIEPDAAA